MISFYKKILNEIENIEEKEKEVNLFCKLEIYYNCKDYDAFQELSEENKEKIINYIYTFYMENDLIENTLFDICDLIFNSIYELNEITNNIDALNYQDFENILNEKI